MATICTSFLGEDWIIDFDYRVTFKGYAGRRPDMNQPGEPAEGMEYEPTLITLRRDLPEPNWSTWVDQVMAARRKAEWHERAQPLDVPDWLKDQIEQWLVEDDRAQQCVADDYAEAA